jgi:cyclic-di-GMP-binding protein
MDTLWRAAGKPYELAKNRHRVGADRRRGLGLRPEQNVTRGRRRPMAGDSSFDIVSKVDRQEVDNALNQTAREISQRFDFKNTGASIQWQGEQGVEMSANSDDRALAILDVFKGKLIKRGVSLKALDAGEPRTSGREVKIAATLKQGIATDQAKQVSKLIRDEGPKGVKVQIQGDELRVSSKKKDDLQSVIALVKDADLDFAVQFVNYR